MTQKERQLLFNDLCARLPYGVRIHSYCLFDQDSVDPLYSLRECNGKIKINDLYYIEEVKPYIFPLSSMTEEQENELYKIYSDEAELISEHLKSDISDNVHTHRFNHHLSLNWYLKNHFDINGLIEKGLAIDATNLNIY